jgi:hypothetical protein
LKVKKVRLGFYNLSFFKESHKEMNYNLNGNYSMILDLNKAKPTLFRKWVKIKLIYDQQAEPEYILNV